MADITFWTVVDGEGQQIPWLGAWPHRADAMQRATEGRMGYQEYERLGSPRARWGYLYRRGYRAVKVRLVQVPANGEA